MALCIRTPSFLGASTGTRSRVALARSAMRKPRVAPRSPVVVASADFLRTGTSTSVNSLIAIGASIALVSAPAMAIGPEMFPLEIAGYEEVTCPEGVPKSAGCIMVQGTMAYTAKKPAYNSEVFGRARLPNGENVIYGAYAEASDAGKISDIAEEVTAKNNAVKFILKIDKEDLGQAIEFSNFKARTYPGMRADFRVIKPVSDGTEECEEASFGLECPEDLPF